ncbi:tRNA pseudouridine synthase B [Magnetospirillum sp. LM-5]|uniref:tRNA pseudouridine(55) synthase TruB n=1 Tax=Magnetospirillum sp. LM-5 TaxID=2681466 RepID=UPI001383287D|nr:tRNA pseudouridine(55) synthase TruB [Magnetospirillum sp. LM-5]CAA7618659.1 tRNA pseudouridine synthase B [Magnetospirillum sp. LM-5]
MARKRKGQPVHGWIAIDKPEGIGSTKVVSDVRRLFDAAKAGHGGTLDPLASGILPIALGEATKTVAYVMDGAKTYRFTIQFGEARSTDDREGEVTATSDLRPDDGAIRAVLPRFIGEVSQVPPAFSALKIDGERAYDLARAGEAVELAARTVRIDRLELIERTGPDLATFEVACGKGTYVRSLARDIASALGTVGHVARLRRTACGPFNETNAIPLDKARSLGHGPALRASLLPILTALDDIPALALTEDEARRLGSGQVFSLRETPSAFGPTQVVKALCDGRLVALAQVEGGFVRSLRGLNLETSSSGEDDVDHCRA